MRQVLRRQVVRPAGRVAERKVAEQQARHADMFDDVPGAAQHHGGDAGRLERARGQADGLVADRAVGHQDRRVGPVLLAAANDLGHVDFERGLLAAVGGRAVKARGQAADAPGRRLPAQRGERKITAEVSGRGVLAVDRHMGDAQVGVAGAVAE